MTIYPHIARKPPKPPWFKTWKTTRGWCGWCGEQIAPGQRKRPNACTWHLECLHEYRSIFDWEYARRIIFYRDNFSCRVCGKWLAPSRSKLGGLVRAYEIDHIIALCRWNPRNTREITQENLLDWYAPWLPNNLQLLCPVCHREKTTNDIRGSVTAQAPII